MRDGNKPFVMCVLCDYFASFATTLRSLRLNKSYLNAKDAKDFAKHAKARGRPPSRGGHAAARSVNNLFAKSAAFR